jgi:hypothetical protein
MKSVTLILASTPLVSLALHITEVQNVWYPFGGSTSLPSEENGAMSTRSVSLLSVSTTTRREMCKTITPFIGTMKSANKQAGVLYAIDKVRENSVPGDIVEAGVARGGGVLSALFYMACSGDMRDRKLHLFDTWAGLPEPKDEHDAGFKKGDWFRSFDLFRQNVDTYGDLYDKHVASNETFRGHAMADWKEVWSHVNVVKGLFADTMATTLKTTPLALLMCDGDMYGSTKDCMSAAGHLVSKGGAIYNDDYYTFKGCYDAVQEWIHEYPDFHMYLVPEAGPFRTIREDSTCKPPSKNNVEQPLPWLQDHSGEGKCNGEIVLAGLLLQEGGAAAGRHAHHKSHKRK